MNFLKGNRNVRNNARPNIVTFQRKWYEILFTEFLIPLNLILIVTIVYSHDVYIAIIKNSSNNTNRL